MPSKLFAALAVAGAVMAAAAWANPPLGASDVVFGETPVLDAGALKASAEVIYTAVGKPVLLFHYFGVGGDCAPTAVSLRLIEPPAHGAVTFQEGAEPPIRAGRPIYADADPRARCIDQLVATRDALYAPDVGFEGHDRVVVEFSEGAAVFTDAIDVNVVSLKPGRIDWRRRR
jgi:hypothetical protein